MAILRTRRPQQAGFNLVEAAIVLGIVGLIVAGIWTAASAVYENLRLSRGTQQVLAIVQNVRTLYGSQANMGNTTAAIINDSLRAARVFPGEMVNGTVISHPWSNDTNSTVFVNPVSATNSTTFRVVYSGIPTSACVQLAVRSSGSPDDVGLVSMAAANSATNNPTTAIANLPATVVTAQTACGTTAGAASSLGFTFNIRG